ncbi:hypothetical protein B0T24DRAFT_399119 [Lasiosphaeria ovina]|uniref:Uncharacterized protein n=1 Tax=Lasiosphaeria ovina TaxID=92902 RepID=A0AAE0N0K1_9PEZI|nr:hypothetical protein B0T24DRAFT_399119 [Lasiosphaeria ovina]
MVSAAPMIFAMVSGRLAPSPLRSKCLEETELMALTVLFTNLNILWQAGRSQQESRIAHRFSWLIRPVDLVDGHAMAFRCQFSTWPFSTPKQAGNQALYLLVFHEKHRCLIKVPSRHVAYKQMTSRSVSIQSAVISTSGNSEPRDVTAHSPQF